MIRSNDESLSARRGRESDALLTLLNQVVRRREYDPRLASSAQSTQSRIPSGELFDMRTLPEDKRLLFYRTTMPYWMRSNRGSSLAGRRAVLDLGHKRIEMVHSNTAEGTVFLARHDIEQRLLSSSSAVASPTNLPENDFFIKFMHISRNQPNDDIMELVVSLALTLNQAPSCAQLYNWFVLDLTTDTGSSLPGGDFSVYLEESQQINVREALAVQHDATYKSADQTVAFMQGHKSAVLPWREWFSQQVNPFFTLVLITQNGGDISLHDMFAHRTFDAPDGRSTPLVTSDTVAPWLRNTSKYWCGLFTATYQKPDPLTGKTFTQDTLQVRLKSFLSYILHVLQVLQNAGLFMHLDFHAANIRSQRVVPYGDAATGRPADRAPYTMLVARPVVDGPPGQMQLSTEWIEWRNLDYQELTVIDFGFSQLSYDFVRQALGLANDRRVETLLSNNNSTETHANYFHCWFDVFRLGLSMVFFILADTRHYEKHKSNANDREFDLTKLREYFENVCTTRVIDFALAIINPPALWMHYLTTQKGAIQPTPPKLLQRFAKTTHAILAIMSYLTCLKRFISAPNIAALSDLDRRTVASKQVLHTLFVSSEDSTSRSAYDIVNTHFNQSLNMLVQYSRKLRVDMSRDSEQATVRMLEEFDTYNCPENVRQWSWFVE